MAYKKVSYNVDRTMVFTKNLKKGDVLEGAYLSTMTDNFGHPAYVLNLKAPLTVQTKKKEDAVLTAKELQPGDEIALYGGGGQLSSNMKELRVGDMIRLTYEGKEEITSGPFAGTPANRWTVEVDEATAAIPF